MKRPALLLLLSLMLSVPSLKAQTFTEDIAPIIYNNCTQCHRDGEIGPMPLTNYQEVRDWGQMIEYVTSIRYMPPWPPDISYSEFMGERFLTDNQIQTIADWVDSGMPQGPAAAEPPLPTFPVGSQIGQPDTVLTFSEAFTHQGNNEDRYQIFVLPTGLTEDKVLKSIELRPGNTKIVHHALFALDTLGLAQQEDQLTPDEYGYISFGGWGVPTTEEYPGYVPGARPRLYPDGIGQPMYAGSDLLIQMHYAPIPVAETDSSSVNLFFSDPAEPIDRMVDNYVMLPFGNVLTNGPFVMFPGQVKTFHGTFTVPYKVSMLGIAPHMHLLGKDWEVYGVHPNGDTTHFINIPDWDFNWQGTYFFKKFVVLEPGTVIHAYATYDNTANNPLNPNDPPRFVSWGEGTADEMFYLPFLFTTYNEGDEFIIFEEDSTATGIGGLRFPENKLYPPYPNPANDQMTVGFMLDRTGPVNVDIWNSQGQRVMQAADNRLFAMGTNKLDIDLSGLSSGIYFIRVSNERMAMSQKFIMR